MNATDTLEAKLRALEMWQARCVTATRGNQTKLGAILLAVLGKSREKRAFGSAGAITDGPDGGHIVARWIDRDGHDHGATRVCSLNELVGNFSGLADQLQLADADRIALFKAVRDWISIDERAIKETLHFTKTR